MALISKEWGVQYDYFGAINTSTAAANTITLNYTPNYENSILFAAFHHNILASGTMATPSGWTLLGSQSFATGNRITLLYAKVSGSTAAASVTGTMSAATGFAAGIVEVSGVGRTPSLSSALTSNLGTNSGTSTALNLCGTGSPNTVFPDTNVSPYLFVTALGATASTATAGATITAQGYPPNWSAALAGGASTSTSIALGLGMATEPHASAASYWSFSASRNCGLVTAIVPMFGRSGLTALGAGA